MNDHIQNLALRDLTQRVTALEQNLIKTVDMLERMAKANADAMGLLAKLSDILGESKPITTEDIPTGDLFSKQEELPRHVLD
jgi:hypothetical protein